MSKPKICIDRIPPQDLYRQPRSIMRGDVRRAVFEYRKMWINGSTLRVRFFGGTAEQQHTAREQAAWWTQHANLKFAFGNDPDAEIRIAFDPSDGAWSYVGTDCRKASQNEPTMNLGFLDGGTAGHEFGHAIGLGHEHQNPQGGIQWNEEAVIRDLSGAPNFWTVDQIRHNVLEKYRTNQIKGTDFDGDSIMLYFFPDSWVRSGNGTKANDVLSDMDKAFIASRDAYPGAATGATEIKVNGRKPVEAEIGKPGEEDLFQFTVKKAGRHVIRTAGTTDLVMKLFGPDSKTTLIAEDDDSGVDLNARIVVDLIPGEYYVQVRHYNLSLGTGSYTVRVSGG